MFIASKELFKPTMMLFKLINLLPMFQTMMNKILWNLINTGKVISFIDNIIIEQKKKRGIIK